MPLIASVRSHLPGTAPHKRSLLERAQALRQACVLIASGRDPLHALKRVGLTYGGVWKLLRDGDATGELRAQWDSAREWSAHYHADRAVRETLGPVGRVSQVMAMGVRVKARQAHAAMLSPAYNGKAAPAAPVSVVHHVVHLPDRGAPPDARALPAIGTLELPSGLLDRHPSSETGAPVLPDVRS